MLACWVTCAYYNIISNISQKKTAKNALFLAIMSAAERTPPNHQYSYINDHFKGGQVRLDLLNESM